MESVQVVKHTMNLCMKHQLKKSFPIQVTTQEEEVLIFVQLGPKLNTKIGLHTHHPPPPPTTTNF